MALEAVLLEERQHVLVVSEGRRGLARSGLGRVVFPASEREPGKAKGPDKSSSAHRRTSTRARERGASCSFRATVRLVPAPKPSVQRKSRPLANGRPPR